MAALDPFGLPADEQEYAEYLDRLAEQTAADAAAEAAYTDYLNRCEAGLAEEPNPNAPW